MEITDRTPALADLAGPEHCEARVKIYGKLLSVNLGKAVSHYTGDTAITTAIRKWPLAGQVALSDLGIVGDEHVRSVHGGPGKALYAYAREDLDWWERELGYPLRNGAFGENLTTEGIDVTSSQAGDVWVVGQSAVLQVTEPRVPCRTFEAHMRTEENWRERFREAGRPGWYLRVRWPARIAAGDQIVVDR